MKTPLQPKFLLIVKPTTGLNIWDLPRPQSEGAIKRRAVPKGTPLDAYSIHNFGGVPYALLVPQDPTRHEWVRVAEADHSIEYVDVIELEDTSQDGKIAQAINNLADAVRSLKAS